MHIDTLKDIVHWTRDYHEQLATRMRQSATESSNPRTQMLLDYLADHEKALSAQMTIFETSSELAALNTWCYEFLDQNPIHENQDAPQPLANMEVEEIVALLAEQHQRIIALYKYLEKRAESASVKRCLTQLLDVERHEIMTMMQGANRLQDM